MSRIANTCRQLLALLRSEDGWSRVWVGLGMAIAMAGGGLIYYQAQQAGEGEANVWIDTDGGTCTWSATAVAYSDAAACGTLDAAWDEANANSQASTVRVKAGDYGEETISGDRTGPNLIEFRAEAGVVTSQIGLGSNCSSGNGYSTDGPDFMSIIGPGSGVYWTDAMGICAVSDSRNISVDWYDGGALAIDDFGNSSPNEPANWLVTNSDFGPCWTDEGPTPREFETHCNLYGGNAAGQIEITGGDNFDFIGNTIHDFDDVQVEGIHFECVRGVGGGAGLWRGNRFWNCQIYDINIGPNTGPNLVIENNWFGASDNTDESPWGHALGIPGDGTAPIIIRNNSFSDGDTIKSDAQTHPADIFEVTGNLLGDSVCVPNVTYSYNIFDDNGATCDATDDSIAGDFPYANASRYSQGDYHITGSSWLGDGFVPSGCAATDYDNASRGSTCDAGSDER